MKHHRILFFSTALLAVNLSWGILELPNNRPQVYSKDWKPVLDSVWAGIKRRNVDAYETGTIHRPKSETPGDAVSEGVGYGMILALYSGDQKYFNQIWTAGEKYMWNGSAYNWRIGQDGGLMGFNAATDADEDVATMLIFADKLVQAGIWEDYQLEAGVTYAQRAQTILDHFWDAMLDGYSVKPGDNFGSATHLNPGYFAPAWYRIWKDFDANSEHDWNAVIDQSYQTIESSSGYKLGMVMDWCTASGAATGGAGGYNGFMGGVTFFKDAIRTLWRIATDAIWFKEPRAERYLNNANSFIHDIGGPRMANFYQMNGDPLPYDSIWTEMNAGNTPRRRREHSHLTIGMWATAAMAVGTQQQKEAFSAELAKFYEGGDYFGLAKDPQGHDEDTLHNEMYFDQFLAWFGASMMAGTFSNIIEDIDNPTSIQSSTQRPSLQQVHLQGSQLLVQCFHASPAPHLMDLQGRQPLTFQHKGDNRWTAEVGHLQAGIYYVQSGNQSQPIVIR